MPLVMLKRNWPGSFRRTIKIKNEAGEVLSSRVQMFSPGEPVNLTAQEVEAIKSDIGAALVPCEVDEKQKIREITDDVVPDPAHAEGDHKPQRKRR